MATKYQNAVAQRTKSGGKLDLSPKSKKDTMSDLEKMLIQAKKKLEQKIAEKDMAGAERVREKIALLEGTINRQK